MRLGARLKIFGGLALACACGPAHAGESVLGKIYTGAAWVEAQPAATPEPLSGFAFLSGPADLRAAARDFLRANARLLGLDDSTQLSETSMLAGPALETHRFRKTWLGIEVLGGESLVHFRNGRVAFANGDGTPLLSLDPAARVSAEEARQIAFVSYRGAAHRAENPELKVLLHGARREPRLVYAVKVVAADLLASDVHYVDAATAQELLVISNVQPAVSREVLAASGGPSDFDVVTDADQGRVQKDFPVLYSDASCAAPATCREADPAIATSALAAWTNSGLVYDYYAATHQRNSVDGNGLTIRSVVNFGGASFQNAAWYNDRRIMLYGMGLPGGRFNDFASPLDVVGHEITHGVTASTAALLYAGEPGALNESYSDVFGKLIAFRNGKADDWKIGKDLFRDGTSFVRDMENPKVGNVSAYEYRGETCSRANDFCGVHDNSGIPSRAAVAIAKRLGLDRFGQLYYLTLTQLLRPGSDFREAKAQTEAACATLFGKDSADCRAVSDAFASMGI